MVVIVVREGFDIHNMTDCGPLTLVAVNEIPYDFFRRSPASSLPDITLSFTEIPSS